MYFIDVNVKDHKHNPVKINIDCILSVQQDSNGYTVVITTGITYYNGSPSSLCYTLINSKQELNQMIDAVSQKNSEFKEVSSRFMNLSSRFMNIFIKPFWRKK